MTRTKVTRIVRVVFLFWVVVSIALVGTTVVTLLPMPTKGTGMKNRNQIVCTGLFRDRSLHDPVAPFAPITESHWPLAVEIDFDSFDSAVGCASYRP